MTSSTLRSPVYDLLLTVCRLCPTLSSDVHLLAFTSVNVDVLMATVRALPDKCCILDPLSTSTLKIVKGDLAPFLAELINRSLFKSDAFL